MEGSRGVSEVKYLSFSLLFGGMTGVSYFQNYRKYNSLR